ncbi:hypothetical protein IWZ00DRAFT_148275 [Phyllosticta capitalensis]
MGFRLSTRGRASFSKQPPTAPAIWNTAPRPSQQKDVCDRRLSQSQGVSKTLVKLSRPLGRPWHRVATLCSSVGLPQAQKWRRLWLSATLASLTTVSKKYSLVLPKTHGHARCDAKQHRTKQPSPQGAAVPLLFPPAGCTSTTARVPRAIPKKFLGASDASLVRLLRVPGCLPAIRLSFFPMPQQQVHQLLSLAERSHFVKNFCNPKQTIESFDLHASKSRHPLPVADRSSPAHPSRPPLAAALPLAAANSQSTHHPNSCDPWSQRAPKDSFDRALGAKRLDFPIAPLIVNETPC